MSSRETPHSSSADAKLPLPRSTKQSAFEKQKAEAEAKRQREAAETAAVYEDFVKSFDHGHDDARRSARDASGAPGRPRPGGSGGGGPPTGVAPRRHFGTSGLKSGPGSLGPATGFTKKRSFQNYSRGQDRPTLAYEDREGGGGGSNVTMAFDASDDEDMGDAVDRAEEKAIARPTLRLSNLPPGTSPAMIRTLLPESLTIENIKIQPPSGPGGSERRCTVAIVTLSKETPAAEMDATVSLLQNRYVGCGCYLSLHRHLSSAVSSSTLPSLTSSSSSGSHPFGAKPVELSVGPGSSERHSKHGHHHRAFAPPSSYTPGGGVNRSELLYVPVKPPQDIRTLQLINKVIEGVLEHGLEFEALLMSRSEVQREEKWAWLWDARSQGGVWYRWTLWEVITGSQSGLQKGKYVPLFEDSHAWKIPEKRLPYEFSTRIDEFVSDPEYNSSDDEDYDGDGNHHENHHHHSAEEEKTFLNPLDKAKLVHLLARLPITLSRVRKGDIARVTAFAITHVSRGVDEIVDLIITNIIRPFSLTGANPLRKNELKEAQLGGGTGGTEDAAAGEAVDASAARLVGLYVVSDILSSSSTSTVRHAWRFRQLFETALRDHKVFDHLGMMAEKQGWGRLRAEKWKRSIHLVLDLWEGWCVFPAESQTFFTGTFEAQSMVKAKDKDKGEADADEAAKKGSRWKLVEVTPAGEGDGAANHEGEQLQQQQEEQPTGDISEELQDDVDGEPIEEDDVAGEPIGDDDVEGESLDEGDVEGEPIDEDDVAGEPMDEDEVEADTPNQEADASSTGRGQAKRRMRAVDMFADSDHSDGGKDR